MELSEYTLKTLRKDGEFILYRGQHQRPAHASPPTILVVTPVLERPAIGSIKRMEHEYSLRAEIDPEWGIRPFALALHMGRTMLVLTDSGGEPLDRLLGRPMELTQFLRLAVGLSVALGQLHGRNLIHKDIKPANVLVNSKTGQVWLTGFGIASLHPRERQSPAPPEFIAGTLAYMAPEQTGRMNRSIDSRSDLYALGITLYEMVTGSLPFTASDPMEWVHCHIARRPVPPSERVKNVPGSVSAIIMKLLAKTAEGRYQTATGAASDLRRCFAEWETHRRIDEFPLGEHDTPDRLLIPEQLYGRASEIETLLASFDHIVVGGRPELVLVSGYSGIGKSSVVNELHKPLVPPRGLFASGKFDQYKRDIPYATLAQALQSLIRPLLSKSETELRKWREAIHAAVDPNGQLMVDLVPELQLIIGEQPPVPELPPQDAQGRFQLVFRRFISVFARPEHPLALFLDDLQWLDAATLDLLEDLLTQADVRHLLLIGAYRDNEVNSAHPLMRKLEAIRKAGAIVQDIVLAPLTCEDLGRLIADSLHCQPDQAAPLTRLIYAKTAGNPFFAIQFISTLAEEGLLTFDHGKGRWSWDVNRIHAKGYTDNVVDLMVGTLNRLPARAQNAVQQLACLGNSADFATLQTVYGGSTEEMHGRLWEAVRAGIIFRGEDSYRFLHDRVQEAAYSLIPQELRAETHLRIGRLLAAQAPPEEKEEAIFEIVNQLNRGSHLITSAEEREQVAEFNLIAAKRAKSSTAYSSALTYLATGRALLTEETWEHNYELIFDIEYHMAECELLTADMAAAESRLLMLTQRAKSSHAIAVVTRLLLTLYTTLGRSDRSVEVCLEYLRPSGTDWTPHPTRDEVQCEYDRIWSLVGSRQIEELVDLPLMTNRDLLDTLDVLAELVTPALFTDENLLSLVICRMVNLSLQHGNSDGSCFAYVWFAIIAGPRFSNYRAGGRFGRLGYDLVEKRGLKRFQARTYMLFGDVVLPWTTHVRTGRDLVRRAFDAAYRVGDLTFAAYSRNHLITNLLAAGDPLAEVQHEAENGLGFAQEVRFGLVADQITAQLGLIRTLRGLTPKFGSFNDDIFDELRFERHLSNDPVLAEVACWYSIRKLQARFFAGDYASAVDASLRAQQLLWIAPSQFETAEFHFHGALSHAASCDSASPDQRQQHLDALATHHTQLKVWAENCPENFANRAALVGAEIARIEGRELDAMRLYEQAMRSARENGFVHVEGVANEVAARFYLTRGFEKIGYAYLHEARYCYLRWGATGKVRQLEEVYPQLRDEKPLAGSTSTIGTPIEYLDLATVVRVSQAVSGEMDLDKLIDTVMRIAIEHAGAERGLLILRVGDELPIEAEASTSGDAVIVRRKEAIVGAVPESIVQYVVRTRESVILDDAAAQNLFSADAYIRDRRVRSILCLPLIHQGKLIGVLYLENNLAPRVFTPARIAVLKVLASQAAISLESTRLYGDLEERETKIRRLVDANILGIFFCRSSKFNGEITEANEAFLNMLQYDREDLASGRLRWTDLTPAEWRDRDKLAEAELMANGSVQPFEKEYFRKDGSRVPVLAGGARFKEGGNDGVAFALDLSEQKRAEEALRRSESYLAQAQRLAHIGSWAFEVPARELVYLSDEWYRLFGFDPKDGIPNWEERVQRIYPEDRAGNEAAIKRAIDDKSNFDLEFRILFPNSTVRHIRSVGHPVLDPSGQVTQFVGVAIDVTASKQAQEERERLVRVQAELAHMNRVSTLGELTASLAHEIKQPIGAAVTNAEACVRLIDRDQPDIQEAREAALEMVKDARRAADIIDRVRSLYQKGSSELDAVDANEIIREMVVMLRNDANRHSVAIHTDLTAGLPKVMADRVQLQQALMNLMLNGLEAMQETGGELSVKSQLVDDGKLLISVADTGVGLPTDDLNKIFDAFFTTKPQGTGLGLAITRSIVKSHGGRIWATANSGRGATFHFTLPSTVAVAA
jgi:PAS domain S-box-containing protein